MKNFNIHNNSSIDNKILNQISGYSVPAGMSKDEAFDKLKQRIASGEKSTKVKQLNTSYLYLAAAASIVLLVGLFVIFNRNENVKIMAANGNHTTLKLPDNSTVTLNAGSEIVFSKNKFNAKRHVTLSGEAFFEVQKGSKFVISTTNGDVTILGTSLNVLSRDNAFKVSCLTGKVQVTSGNHSEIITPGESVEKQNNTLIKNQDANLERKTSWRKGEFYFENIPLNSTFAEIERQFNVRIEAQGFENRFFSGSFSNKNLIETLDIVCIPMEIEYEIKNGTTVIVHPKTK